MSYPSTPPPPPPSNGNGAGQFSGFEPAQGFEPGPGPDPYASAYGNGAPSQSPSQHPSGKPQRSFLATWLMALFFGHLGLDRFYVGKIGTGIAKFLTIGGLGIWSTVDLIITLLGKQTDKEGRPLQGYEQHKVKAWAITGGLWLVSIAVGIVLALTGVIAGGAAINDVKPVPTSTSAPQVTDEPTAPEQADPSKSAEAQTPITGDPITVQMGDGNTAEVTIGRIGYAAQIDDSEFATPPANGGFLVMEIKWETKTGTTNSDPFLFEAEGADGNMEFPAFVPEGALEDTELKVGESAQGYLAFDIAKQNNIIVTLNKPNYEPAAQFTVNPAG